MARGQAQEMPAELSSLFLPQMEQLDIELVPEAGAWRGTARCAVCEGSAWLRMAGPYCLIVQHEITPLVDIDFSEAPVSDYACVCLVDEDTRANMPFVTHQPNPLLDGSVYSFLQPAGPTKTVLRAGSCYSSRSINLLPGYFRELERLWPGEYAGLFEAFTQAWNDEAARMILATLRCVGPRSAAGAGLLLTARVEQMVATLAESLAARERGRTASGSGTSAAIAAQARGYVEHHLAERLTVERMARELYVSRSQLCAVFRAETGLGLAEYARIRRMDIARELLATTDLSVAEIARRVGYPRATTFSTAFSRACGTSPTTWRAHHS